MKVIIGGYFFINGLAGGWLSSEISVRTSTLSPSSFSIGHFQILGAIIEMSGFGFEWAELQKQAL